MEKAVLLLVIISAAQLVLCAPKLTVSPTVLSTSQTVQISWGGLSNPSDKDIIAIYTPADSKEENYIGWLPLTKSSSWESGFGNLVLPLLNTRSNYLLRLWHYDSNTQQTAVVATSPVLTFKNPNEPTNAHLALTQNPSEMRVMWTTRDPLDSVVYVGTQPGIYYTTFTGSNPQTYTIDDMCDKPANDKKSWRDPGYFHDVVLTGLQASTRYYYKYGSTANNSLSAEQSFVSSPGVGPNITIRFIAYGDLGVLVPFSTKLEQQEPSVQTAKWALRDLNGWASQTPLVIHIGDVSYARGWGHLWDWFSSMIEPLAVKAPYMIGIGNHEYDYPNQPWKPDWSNYGKDSGGECGIPYSVRFHMPNDDNIADGIRNLWYSYEYGPVHFIVMSSEHNFLEDSEQYNWLVNDMMNVDRTRTPWLIFMGHRPMYTSSDEGSEKYLRTHLREIYEPLLLKFKVDLCFWGHVHQYERTCGMKNFTCAERDEDAPVHVVIGMAGNTYQSPWITRDPPPHSYGGSHQVQPDWSIFRTDNFGYSRLEVSANHLHFEMIGDNRGEIHDVLDLYK
jgi:hypothetical protein